MYLFDLFRSFLPYHNPIGFGVSDFVALALAILLSALALLSNRRTKLPLGLPNEPAGACLLWDALPIILRMRCCVTIPCRRPAARTTSVISCWPTRYPLPTGQSDACSPPLFRDELRIAAAILQFHLPLGPALPLALGQLLFGLPWAGCWFRRDCCRALCYWMLRGWTTAGGRWPAAYWHSNSDRSATG